MNSMYLPQVALHLQAGAPVTLWGWGSFNFCVLCEIMPLDVPKANLVWALFSSIENWFPPAYIQCLKDVSLPLPSLRLLPPFKFMVTPASNV